MTETASAEEIVPTPCSTCASTSTPRTTRGPGRLKYAGPSTTQTRPDRTAGSDDQPGRAVSAGSSASVRSGGNPHGASTSTSGAAATTTDQSTGSVCAPATPSTSVPPAAATWSGTQCPTGQTGSSHSSTTTRGRGRPATAPAAAASRRSASASAVAARFDRPVSEPTVVSVPSTSASVVGSSETSRGPVSATRTASATCPYDTAQTSHSSWVRIRSGSSAASAGPSSAYSEEPAWVRSAATAAEISRLPRPSASAVRVTTAA